MIVKNIFKILFLVTFIVIFLGSLFYTMQALKKPVTVKDEQASEADVGVTLFTSPSSLTVVKGDSFTVDLDLNTQTENISGVDLVFNYDKNFLQVNSIIPRNMFPKVVKKNNDGNGNISLILSTDPGTFANGEGTLASINFTALSSGKTTLSYANFSQVSAPNNVVNILSTSIGANIDINSPSAIQSASDNTNPIPTSKPQGSIIDIFASGTFAHNQYPIMELFINGERSAIFYDVSEKQKKYTYQHSTIIGPNQVSIKFTNDYNDRVNNQDRNLKINKIKIDGIIYESESPSTFSTGSWQSGGCGSGFNKSEWLYCNGEFIFSP